MHDNAPAYVISLLESVDSDRWDEEYLAQLEDFNSLVVLDLRGQG